MGTLVEDLGRQRQLIETHISWVFLDGQFVYKVKKPVDFGFLDFRHLEQRRAACEREVELNRRLTNDVYLGVVPITRDSAGLHSIAGEGTVVDYAVHMIQLSDASRLDVALQSSDAAVPSATVERSSPPCSASEAAWNVQIVRRLALRLAQFHASATSNAEVAEFGSVKRVRTNVQENFAQTRDHILQFVSPEHAQQLERLQLKFLSENQSLFSQRVQAGRIRDGHGDLRLEHVYLADAGFQILDCIEFNDRFRYADVCADIAFLTMDLRHQDMTDLAEAFLATYAQASGDYDMYALVDFYESYRALVRAKIQSFLVADQTGDARLGQDARREARRYYLQALLAERPPLVAPVVVAVGGLIASGKSHTSELISQILHCPVIDSDRTRKQLFAGQVSQTTGHGHFEGMYSAAATDQVYDEVCRRARVVLDSGRSVVLDASFRTRQQRARLLDLCKSPGRCLLFVECQAPEATLRARLAQRETQPSISDARNDLLEDFTRSYEAGTELPAERRLVLDTTQDAAALRAALTRFLLD